MFEKGLLCFNCGRRYPAAMKIFRCRRCGGSLEVDFDYGKIRRRLKSSGLGRRPLNHARYIEFYPVKGMVSLSEGGTPLMRSKKLERAFKLPFELYFKCESANPTGSFKDRGSSVEVAKALEFGARTVVCASTGNMGASVAAYSAPTELDCHIFTPKNAVHTKIEQIIAYGAHVYRINSDYARAAEIVEQACRKHKAYLLGDYLYRREGTKSVGFEMLDQARGLGGFDYVFSPVGNGTLVSAIWKAFREFRMMGFVKKLPSVVGVQAKGCAPVYNAFRSMSPEIHAVKGKTVAVAIECGDPLDGGRCLKSIKESHGFLEVVRDDTILKTRELLANKEGLFAEPAGAVALAGLLKSKAMIERGSRVVCVVTGHGLKSPRTGVRGHVRKIRASERTIKSIFG